MSAINTRAWRKTRLVVLARDGYRCHYCGGVADQVDHLVPRKDGGTNELTNLVACCGADNLGRAVMDITPDELVQFHALRQTAGNIISSAGNSTNRAGIYQFLSGEMVGELGRRTISPQIELTADYTRPTRMPHARPGATRSRVLSGSA